MYSRTLWLAVVCSLSACTVGPVYQGPPDVVPNTRDGGKFVRAVDASLQPSLAPARWWEALGDSNLTALVDDALAKSPSIDIAIARVEQSRAALGLRRAEQFPTASVSMSYVHAELPGFDLGGGSEESESSSSNDTTALDLYNLGLNASWELDLFGGRRRAREQATATAEARIAELSDVQVSLAADVAQTYINLRDVQERARLFAESARLQEKMLSLARQRFTAGASSALDVDRIETQYENTQAQLLPLQAQTEQYLNQLAMLTGREPGALDAQLATAAAIPLPPAEVPVGDPAELLRHRPDIRSAERNLAASNAAIGVNVARRFPTIKFMGLIGTGGSAPSDMFDLDELILLAAPTLQWSVLDFGKSGAAVRQSEAQRDEAEAQYRRAVLTALNDAETSLSRFGYQRRQLGNLARAEAAATRAAAFSEQRYRAGTSSLIDQLDIERQRISAAAGLVQGRAALTSSYVAVQKSLGLGWSAP
ncbi:efflux transporter outer membrane subunit [Steroidobacter sp.]|uniref:efflux transporter outer membrane subunit n=1 Tax=Steroidobacter sp. TaxID=1978227 RepID=UPI001A4AE3C3|nr:efflux transporter outer membrane subunit [Steroidobacter sp.]MBL8269958.1 efflux transporter outer membrane subunit [Steroidobacter sp.]